MKLFNKNRLHFECNSWDDYWSIFNNLIESLKSDNNKDNIVLELKDAQKYVNGLTDGWFDFKSAFEKVLKNNNTNMTENQIQIFKFLIYELKKVLKNR